jgi:hypothetical protein
MCRRAIEALCRHFGVILSLEKGLVALKDRGIIDGMLLQWAEALRLHGNIGAHPDPKEIMPTDAGDLYGFAFAICEYVFVLGEKFRKFRERTASPENSTAVQ